MAQISDLIGQASIDALKKYFDEKYSEENVANNYAKGLANELEKKFGKGVVKRNGTNLNIAYRILSNIGDSGISFYDMKPAFKQSAKVKTKKNGGWYLVVPVGGTQSTVKMRQAYGRQLWDQISHIQFGDTGGQQANIDRFRKILANSGESETAFAYQWKSTKVTREQWGSSGKRAHYITFRTVSDTSDPASWIRNRNSVNDEINKYDLSPDQVRAVSNVIKNAIKRSVEEYNQEVTKA